MELLKLLCLGLLATGLMVLMSAGEDRGASRRLAVRVDILPGTCPNTLTPDAEAGRLAVAVLGTGALDVADIDVTSVRLAGQEPANARLADVAAPSGSDPLARPTGVCTTAGPDGRLDLVLHFDSAALASARTAEVMDLALVGQLTDGTPISGSDEVRWEPTAGGTGPMTLAAPMSPDGR